MNITPNSLGGNNENNIAIKYRGIDPSYIGRLDICVCGTSDPGTSVVLTPFCETNGLYFDGSREPESFKYKFDKAIDDFTTEDSDIVIGPNYTSPENYYNYLKGITDMNEKIKIKREQQDTGKIYIHINTPDDEDI